MSLSPAKEARTQQLANQIIYDIATSLRFQPKLSITNKIILIERFETHMGTKEYTSEQKQIVCRKLIVAFNNFDLGINPHES